MQKPNISTTENINAGVAPANEVKEIVIQKLTVRPADLSQKTIDQWSTARRSAKAIISRTVLLYDLYEDILGSDGHLNSVIEKRIMAVLNANWQFVNDGKVNSEVGMLIDSPGFSDLLRSIMSSVFWGYAMTELTFQPNGSFNSYCVPKKHMRPYLGIIATDQYTDSGINIRQGIYQNTIIETGKPGNFGLLLIAAVYALYKRGNTGDWAQFNELFGMPFRKATYDGYDDAQRIALENTLDRMGGASYAVIPAGSTLDLIETNNNSDGQLYQSLGDYCNAEMSKLILGQTMTTENGASLSQSKTHKEVEDSINLADLTMVRHVLNTRGVAVLKANGINTDGGKFIISGLGEEKVSKKDNVDILIKLRNEAKLPIDDEYIYEQTGIPKPANYEALKKAMEAEEEEPAEPGNDSPKKEKKPNGKPATEPQRLPKPTLKGLFRSFIELAADLPFFAKAPEYPGLIEFYSHAAANACCVSMESDQPLPDNPETDKALETLLSDAYTGKLKKGQISLDYYFATANTLMKGVDEGLGGSTFIADDYRNTLKAYLSENIYAFSAAKNLTMLQAFRDALTDDKGDLESFSAFKKKVSGITDNFNKVWLRAEYDSAIASAQMADKWQTLKDCKRIQYSTAGDARVRPTHAALNGTIYDPSDPLVDSIYPPKDFGCRCTMIPAPDNATTTDRETVKTMADAMLTKPYFKKHVGKSKVVFDGQHPYFKIEKAAKKPMQATRNYNMPSVAKIYERPHRFPALIEMGEQEAKEWLDSQMKGEGSFSLPSVDGLTWTFNKKNFVKHIFNQNIEENRSGLAHLIPDILANPDEVWARREIDHGKHNEYYTYLKYYKEFPVRFGYDFESEKWTIMKMDRLGANQNLEERVRTGSLKYRSRLKT